MIIIIIILLLLIGISILTNSNNFTEVITLDMQNKVYEIAYTLGMNYLNINIDNDFFNLKHPAVMFDIDDTLIHYSGKPIKPMIKLLMECIKLNLIIIIITARDFRFKDETIKELRKHGINYDLLYLRKQTDNIRTFKSNIKENLKKTEDITIILSVGDNIIDVDGEYSGYFIKLPNTSDSKLYHLNSEKKLEVVQV